MTKLNATDLSVSPLYILASLVSMECDFDPWNFQFVAPIAIATADMAALVPVHVGNGALARNTLAQGVRVPTVCNNNKYTSEILKSFQTCQSFSLILNIDFNLLNIIWYFWKLKYIEKQIQLLSVRMKFCQSKHSDTFQDHWHRMVATESKNILNIKVTVKVSQPLTLVPIEMTTFVEYLCQIWSIYLKRFNKSSQEGTIARLKQPYIDSINDW